MNRLIPYYRARYYSPQIGRFLSRDPLGSPLTMLDANEPWGSAELKQGPNLYWYVQDNAPNAFDATGKALSDAETTLTTTLAAAMALIVAEAANLFGLCQTDSQCRKDCLSCCTLTGITEFGALDSGYFTTVAGCYKLGPAGLVCALIMEKVLFVKTDSINELLAQCRINCIKNFPN